MVILHIKRSDLNQFLFETNCNIPVADLLEQLVRSKSLSRRSPANPHFVWTQ